MANQVMLLKKNNSHSPTHILFFLMGNHQTSGIFSSPLQSTLYSSTYFVLQTAYGVLLIPLDIISKGNICALNLTLLFQPVFLHLKGHYSITLACFRTHYRAFDTPRTAWLSFSGPTWPQGCLRILVSINQMLRWISSMYTEDGFINVKVLLTAVMKHG